jgi:hypothetical protein
MSVDGDVSRWKKPHLLTWLNTLASTSRRLVSGAVQSPVMMRCGCPQRFCVPPTCVAEMSDGHLHDVCCDHEKASLLMRFACHVTRPYASFHAPLLIALRFGSGV